MTPRDYFEIGIRLLGVWEILQAITDFIAFLNILLKLYSPTTTLANSFLTHAIAHLIAGCFLLFFVNGIVNAAYPRGQFGRDTTEAEREE